MPRSLLPLLSLAATVPALAQPAPRTTVRVLEDNAHRRVVQYVSRPGSGVCGIGLHSHPAHWTVLQTPVTARVVENGKVMLVTQPAGTRFWSPAVTHRVENAGRGEARVLIVEPKTAPR